MNPKRVINSIRIRGLKGSVKRLKDGSPLTDICGFWNFIVNTNEIEFCYEDYQNAKKSESKILNWVIPEPGKGSGGHLNIFRFISYLEEHGIHNRIYIFKPINFSNNESFKSFLREYFSILNENVEIYYDTKYMQFAHGTVATGWTTAYCVQNFNNTISKFYFIQDFEPYFYAYGSEFSFAENTYKFGFRGITAGDWLKDICIQKYGMIADSFSFSYDLDLYKPKKKLNKEKRIFFYARPVTPRRDFELGLLALHELSKMIPDLTVVFAGWDLSQYKIPFKYESKGILDISELSELYSSCDMCLVISNTNLSLLPLEVMASGSVAVCTKGANSEWLVNDQNSVLVDIEPKQIAQKIAYYFDHPKELDMIRENGIHFAQNTSWKKEGHKVFEAIMRGIEEDEKNINNRW